MKHNIICTGNPDISRNLAYTVRKYFPDAKFIYKSNGYDLLTENGLKLFQDEISNYNVFLNCSYIDAGVQESLLKITRRNWITGHVFNIGSIVEFITEFHNELLPNSDISYVNSKISLKKVSAFLGTYDFKSTYMILGGFKDVLSSTDPRLDPNRILEIIKWILTADDFLVPIIGVVGPQNQHL